GTCRSGCTVSEASRLYESGRAVMGMAASRGRRGQARGFSVLSSAPFAPPEPRCPAVDRTCREKGALLNLAEIQSATLKRDPYPYMVVEDVINADAIEAILGDFPAIDYPGSIPVSEVRYGPAFQALLDELNGPAFRDTIAARFGLDLANRPIMTTVRGVMRDKDGRIHTDSKTKVITRRLHLNQDGRDEGRQPPLPRKRT